MPGTVPGPLMHCLIPLSDPEVGIIIIPNIPVWKLGFREVEKFAQGHKKGSKWWKQDAAMAGKESRSRPD